MKARAVAGSGEKSLLLICDPGSELRVGRRERRRCAKIMNGIKKRKKKKYLCGVVCDRRTCVCLGLKNRHGRWLCWMSTGRKNGLM